MNTKSFKKYFTPKEANKRLPYVKMIVSEILTKGRSQQLESAKNENEKRTENMMALQAEIEGLMMELEDLGCYFKDWNFEIGLVDFPAKINGQEVFLCWRSDEPDVRFYHTIDGGFNARQPIPESYLHSLN